MTRVLTSMTTLGLLLAVACSSSSTQAPYSPPPGDSLTEQEDGTCPSSSTILRGTKPAGAACTEGADCAPVCCSCDNGSNRKLLAVHCKTGTCVGEPEVCTDALAAHPEECTSP
jgi:hypothetical protein